MIYDIASSLLRPHLRVSYGSGGVGNSAVAVDGADNERS